MERDREKEFEDYFGEDLATVSKTADQTAAELGQLSTLTGTRSALLYVIPRDSHLHLVLITPNGTPIVKDFYDVEDPLLFKTAHRFHNSILRLNQAQIQETGQQLYDWIIKPYEQELKEAKISLLRSAWEMASKIWPYPRSPTTTPIDRNLCDRPHSSLQSDGHHLQTI